MSDNKFLKSIIMTLITITTFLISIEIPGTYEVLGVFLLVCSLIFGVKTLRIISK